MFHENLHRLSSGYSMCTLIGLYSDVNRIQRFHRANIQCAKGV